MCEVVAEEPEIACYSEAMPAWIPPLYSSSRVKTAGKRFRSKTATFEDTVVLENWRASHGYVLNTFQSALRNRARGRNVTVGQRLKRRPTIIDKLIREPHMQLNTMHDLAGCRLIFSDIESLLSYRESLHASRGMRHILKNGDNDKYNYIHRPKLSGYRGIHDVYEYRVRSQQGQRWSGLHIEIQYRTIYQHAWATAVEVADLVNINRIKFSEADDDSQQFFRLASEVIARAFEEQHSCLYELKNSDVVGEFLHLSKSTGILEIFKNLVSNEGHDPFRPNTILIFYFEQDRGANQLEIKTFNTINEALEAYNRLENELAGKADVVFVRADTEASVRSAFRNYFSDTTDFVRFIEAGIEHLMEDPGRSWA